MHFRRTIVEDADEVLGVAVALHPVGISQRHPVRNPFSAICSDAVITVDDSALRATALSGPSTIRPVATGVSVWTFTVTRVPSGP